MTSNMVARIELRLNSITAKMETFDTIMPANGDDIRADRHGDESDDDYLWLVFQDSFLKGLEALRQLSNKSALLLEKFLLAAERDILFTD